MTKPIPAIVEKQVDVEHSYAVISVALAGERDAGNTAARHEQLGAAARETQKLRRLEIGRELLKVRSAWPASGPRAKGWSEFLARVKLDDSTAVRYMQEARTGTVHGEPGDSAQKPNLSQNSDRNVTPDNVTQLALVALVPDPPADDEPVIERDTWCTPKWITDTIGRWDLDPCSNKRSTVQAHDVFDLEDGARMDGLHPPSVIDDDIRVFINPPYSNVRPWIDVYAHTRFCFLLKLDPSTKWFAELLKHTELILLPRGTRVEFVAPEGVPADKSHGNPFPHALFYARAADATAEIRALCWAWRVERD